MRTRSRVVAVVVVMLAAAAFQASFAAAQPVQTAQGQDAKLVARELADKGFERYQAGEYAQAIPYLHDAEARFHAPTLLLMEGNAHAKLGHLLEAKALYQRVADEVLASDSPDEFRNAQVEAKKGLDSLDLRIAQLKIVIKGTNPDNVRILIDDVEVKQADPRQPIPQNPGTHKVVAQIGGDDGGGRAVFQSVTLKEGTTKQIQLVFRPGGEVKPVAPQSGGCAACEIERAGAGSGSLGWLASAALGLGLGLRRRKRAS